MPSVRPFSEFEPYGEDIKRVVASKEGEVVNLTCGCTVPPGCSCEDRLNEAAIVTQKILLATGLSFEELGVLRDHYMTLRDPKGLCTMLGELAKKRGIVLCIGYPEGEAK